MCKARGIESHIKFSVLEIYKKTDLQLENTVTNTLIPVLDVEPRGLSDLISSKRACCAVWLREGGGKEKGKGWREIVTMVSMKQPHTQGRVVHPGSRKGV